MTFFENAKSKLPAPLFTADLKKGSPGTYTFGFIDNTKYTGEIAYVLVDSSKGFWQFSVDCFVIDGGSSGTTSFDGIVYAYYDGVSSASYDSGQGGYTFPCGTKLPSITFAIGGQNAVVPGSFLEYAPLVRGGTSECLN